MKKHQAASEQEITMTIRRKETMQLSEAFQLLHQDELQRAYQAIKQNGTPVFSEKYLENIKKLKEKGEQQQKKYVYFGSRAFSRAAVIAVVILAGTVGSVTAYAVNRGISISMEQFDDHSRFYFSLTDEQRAMLPDEIQTQMELTRLPKGYERDRAVFQKDSSFITYLNEDKQSILFIQNVAGKSVINVDTEGAEVKQIRMFGMEAYYIVQKGDSHLIWCDGMYQYTLITPEMKMEKLVEIAESIKEIEAE